MRALAWLDPWLLRRPFEGNAARRYAALERPAFGNLDARLAARMADDLARARVFADIGAGEGWFAAEVVRRYASLHVIAVEPSATFAARAQVRTLRARAEALPLPNRCVDTAMMLSAIRHVADRAGALRELRRVVSDGGAAWIVELDPEADPTRTRRHRNAIGSSTLRLAFDPWVLRSAPPAEAIVRAARAAGFSHVEREDDPEQPVYLLRMR